MTSERFLSGPSRLALPCFTVIFSLSGPLAGQPPGYDDFPRTPGVLGEFVQIADQPALEVSDSPGGILVLTEGNNLDFYFGEDFSQRLPILQNGPFFALSKKGFERNGEILFSFIDNNDIKLLRINPGQEPQGTTFSVEEVATEDHFWSSDLFVTPEGEILVLGYFVAQGGGFSHRACSEEEAQDLRLRGSCCHLRSCHLGCQGFFSVPSSAAPAWCWSNRSLKGTWSTSGSLASSPRQPVNWWL